MADIVTTGEINAWLDGTKLSVSTVEQELQSISRALIFSQVGAVYDTTTWVDTTTTPELIRKLVAALIAVLIYRRAYSEIAVDTITWADKIEELIQNTLIGILSGNVDLLDVPGQVGSAAGPTFIPNDISNSSEVFDALGWSVGLAGENDIKFRMSTRF